MSGHRALGEFVHIPIYQDVHLRRKWQQASGPMPRAKSKDAGLDEIDGHDRRGYVEHRIECGHNVVRNEKIEGERDYI